MIVVKSIANVGFKLCEVFLARLGRVSERFEVRKHFKSVFDSHLNHSKVFFEQHLIDDFVALVLDIRF